MSVKIMISRTDNIGDVVLTLPLANYLKSKINDCEIYFLGKPYTKDIIEACSGVDHFVDVTELSLDKLINLKLDWFFHIFPDKNLSKLAKQAKIPNIVGTRNRIHHWGKCQHLVKLSRKKSGLHESQLNFKLLQPLVGEVDLSINEIQKYIDFKIEELESNPKMVLLHTMSHGSAVNWSFDNFRNLARELVKNGYRVGLTGTEKEGMVIRTQFSSEIAEGICQDLTGKFSIQELMSFIKGCYGLVAASTGPLHLASVLGVHAFGLYSQVEPLDAGRWAPIGEKVHIINADDKGLKPDINLIAVDRVLDQILISGR